MTHFFLASTTQPLEGAQSPGARTATQQGSVCRIRSRRMTSAARAWRVNADKQSIAASATPGVYLVRAMVASRGKTAAFGVALAATVPSEPAFYTRYARERRL